MSHPASRGDNGPAQELAAQPEGSAEPTGNGLSQVDIGGFAQGAGGSVLKSPARRLGLGRSLIPQSRPLPPPAPDDEEEILNPFARRGLRRTPPPGVETEPVVPEPELPPTPEHPDPVVSTPPSGIHNTPSRRPRRNRALAERIKSSSPLKNPPVVSSPDRDDAPPPFKLPTKSTNGKSAKAGRPRSSQGLSTAEIRGIQPGGPDVEKRKLRDALLAEVAELEHDLDVAAREIERLQKAHSSKARSSPPHNKQDILGLLRRHTLPQDKEPEAAPSTTWLHSALDPIAFLPFGRVTSKPATLFPSKDSQADQDPPVSHHPLPMSAEESLPYLQVFTPLTFTTHITTLPNPDNPSPDGPLLQNHSISATSAALRGLFSAHIDMTVNTRTMAVVDLSVSRLDPNASAELQPFIDRISAKTQPSNSGLNNNVNILGWAMGEWIRLATQRARAWCVLEKELGGGRPALERLVERIKQKKRKKRRRKGADDEDEDEDGQVEGKEDSARYDTADLLPFMGRTSTEFEIPLLVGGGGDEDDSASVLRVQWRIGFDWTGEGRIEVGVLVGVPGKCELRHLRSSLPFLLLIAPGHKCDERGRLSNIPRLFDDLIGAGEEPVAAVRTVACLLAGGQRA